MPYTNIPPSSPSEILATATPDLTWSAALKASPLPSGADITEIGIESLKEYREYEFPSVKSRLAKSCPSDIQEDDIDFNVPSTDLYPQAGAIRVRTCMNTSSLDSKPRPLITIFHGGGHTVGFPESEVPLARELVKRYDAVIILPAYRLAPGNKFPASFNDCFEVVKALGHDLNAFNHVEYSSEGENVQTRLLPTELNLRLNGQFILAGTSAGATIAASCAHLYHKYCSHLIATIHSSANDRAPVDGIAATVTGLLLVNGSTTSPSTLPTAYQPHYLSRTQNSSALPVDKELYDFFSACYEPDFTSPTWNVLNQRPKAHLQMPRERSGEDHTWMRDEGIRVAFQVCGKDMARDDALIYERVLREESGVETRLDFYQGFGHCFWLLGQDGGVYKELAMSKKRMRDTVNAVGWLLRERSSEHGL